VERFIKGDIVVVPFPFTNLAQSKRRPAYVLADLLSGDDVILCQITSQNIKDAYAIPLNVDDFEEGSLNKQSNIRPNKIFTADKSIILYKVGRIKEDKINEVKKAIIDML